MKNYFTTVFHSILTTTLFLAVSLMNGQQASGVWNYGGTGYEAGEKVIECSDGGYVIVGSTKSNDGHFDGMNNSIITDDMGRLNDIFVMKISGAGAIDWINTFGGSSHDYGHDVVQTEDGGFIVVGRSTSNDWYFEGMNLGGSDIIVIKISETGELEWKRAIGGSDSDVGNTVDLTSDGHIIIGGSTDSNDGDFAGQSQGNTDIAVVKLTSTGETVWVNSFGGTSFEGCKSVVVNGDDEIFITGSFQSDDGVFENLHLGWTDVFVMKLSSEGDIEWNSSLKGDYLDSGKDILYTTNGGCVITGYTDSEDGDFAGMSEGGWTIFVAKFNELGENDWIKTYGGSSNDWSNSIASTSDGGFVITGHVESTDFDFEGLPASGGEATSWGGDIFVIKLTSDGDAEWFRKYGGSFLDQSRSIITTDGGFVLTGLVESDNGDFEELNVQSADILLLKLDGNGNLTTGVEDYRTSGINIFPNPTTDGIYVYSDDKMNGATFELLNCTGDRVKTGFFNSNNDFLLLDNVASGIYFLRISDGLFQGTYKVIKE